MTFRHRAGVSPYTSSFDFAETCVFGKQSLGPFHCGPLGLSGVNPRHPTGASLLPKLRDHFAEFLNEGSSDRLGILYLPTCVGLVRARSTCLDAFLGGMAFGTSRLTALGIPSQAYWVTDFPITRPTRLPQDDHRLGFPSLPRPAIGGSGGDVVQEYQPVVHRLRLAASA